MGQNYCVILEGDAKNILQDNVYIMNSAVQSALNAGCSLQGGVSTTTWKLANGQNMFGFVQAALCNAPCAQVIETTTKKGNSEIQHIISNSGDIHIDSSCNGAAQIVSRTFFNNAYWVKETTLVNNNDSHRITVTVRCTNSNDKVYELAAGEHKVIADTIEDGHTFNCNVVGCEMFSYNNE